MDSSVIQYIISGANGVASIALYLYVQSREDKMREEYDKKFKDAVAKAEAAEDENRQMKTNYRDRFEKVYEGISDIKVAIAQIQTLLRGAA